MSIQRKVTVISIKPDNVLFKVDHTYMFADDTLPNEVETSFTNMKKNSSGNFVIEGQGRKSISAVGTAGKIVTSTKTATEAIAFYRDAIEGMNNY